MLKPLTTQLVGSYAKPPWLVCHERAFRIDGSAWLVDGDLLGAARQDAARLAIYEQEQAGLALLTDGEAQRSAYDRHFYARLRGIDAATLGSRPDAPVETAVAVRHRADRAAERSYNRRNVPRIVGPIEWPGPLSVDELAFLKRHTAAPTKVTVVGPLTAYANLLDEHYGDEAAAITDLAAALGRELRALEDAGADVLQIDEPYFHAGLSLARRHGLAALTRMTAGLTRPVVVHVCYGYAYSAASKATSPLYAAALEMLASCDGVAGISLEFQQPRHTADLLRSCGTKHVILGLLDLGTSEVETPDAIAERLRAALTIVPPERLHPAPDCGMWHLPRATAFAKLAALVAGTAMVKRELGLA
jgi:5-methyltetrahydropteroyltriglutamate--homocysteine methyltransferase